MTIQGKGDPWLQPLRKGEADTIFALALLLTLHWCADVSPSGKALLTRTRARLWSTLQ